MLKIDESLEVGLYSTVSLFSLAVSLQIENGKKPMLNVKEVGEQWPEFWGEKRALIGDNKVLQAVVIHYYVYYSLYKPECIDDDLNRFVVNYLSK